jgi:hypothetical protein
MRDLHVMQLNLVECCGNWDCMTILFRVKGIWFRLLWKPYGILKVKDTLVRSAYCITEDVICGFILQMIGLSLGFTQPCAYWVSLLAVKWMVHEASHPPQCSSEVKVAQGYTYLPHTSSKHGA